MNSDWQGFGGRGAQRDRKREGCSYENHGCEAMSEVPSLEPGASVMVTSKFICVETLSGYSSRRVDHRGRQIYLPPDPDNGTMGVAVNEALKASRLVVPHMADGVPDGVEIDPELFNYELNIERYDAWIQQTSSRFGFRSKRALFKLMRKCLIEVKNSQMLIRPMAHKKLEHWTQSLEMAQLNVVISASAEPAVIGEALQLALSRCI